MSDHSDRDGDRGRRFWRWRNPLLLGAGVLLALLAVSGGNVVIASNSGVCEGCHEIRPLYQQWLSSSHKNAKCLDCHTDPGWAGWAKVNVSAVQNSFKHITNSFDEPIKGHVDDESCLSCHPKSERPEVIAASSLRIAHSAHDGQRCADCHGRLVHTRKDSLVASLPMAESHGEKDCLVCHQIQSCPHGSAKVTCSSCHSANIPGHNVAQDRGIFPRESCIDCHTKERVASPEDCQTCHVSPHGIDLNCSKCHASSESWTERSLVHPIKLVGAHEKLQCVKCHTSGQDFSGLEYKCASCHEAPHPPKADNDCATCHSPVGWSQLDVQHQKLWDGYEGAHAAVSCRSCHETGDFGKLSSSCDSCHTRPHQDYGQECSTCHTSPGVKWM